LWVITASTPGVAMAPVVSRRAMVPAAIVLRTSAAYAISGRLKSEG
jgi:hypothetical protein